MMYHSKKIQNKAFTLIELLVAISIMIIVAGIGVRGYKRMAGEMSITMVESQVRQLVNATISEAKRNQVPMQIQVFVSDKTSEPCVVGGGTSSLVAYFGFDDVDQKKGINNMVLSADPTPWEGYYGKGAYWNGSTNQIRTGGGFGGKYGSLDFRSNVYVELMVKPDVSEILASSSGTFIQVFDGDGVFKIEFEKGNINGVNGLIIKGGSVASKTLFPDDGEWHKIGALRMYGVDDDTKMTAIYLDGVMIFSNNSSGAAPIADKEQDLKVGGSGYIGAIDEVKVFTLGTSSQVFLDPRDTYLRIYDAQDGEVKGKTKYINISPYGTTDTDVAIQILSTRITGSLTGSPGATVGDTTINKIRSSFPRSGYVSFDGALREYTWDGDDTLTLGRDQPFGTSSPNSADFNFAKPVVINRDGTVH